MSKADEKQIQNLMDILGCTREEAIDTLSFDKGEAENEEVNKIEGKAADNPKEKKKGSSLDKVKTQRAKKKVDQTRVKIMGLLQSSIYNGLDVDPQSLTASKLTFKIDGEYYSVTLTKHKTKPDGYSEE